MKFIESLELREWVKDSLKKTIFQKAHALAVQTGCEILVKLHDTADISGCQYYATKSLRKVYKSSKLKQDGEMLVSGETGLPYVDKCIQYEDEPIEDTDGVATTPDDDGGGEDGVININQNFTVDSGTQDGAVPMQITAAGDGNVSSNFGSQMPNQRTVLGIDAQTVGTQVVKQEPMYEHQQQQQFNQGSTPGMMQTMPQQDTGLGAFSFPISPKPYQCSICRKAFKSVHVLQKHTLTFHTGGSTGATRSRGRGRGSSRGSRGSRARGRGRGISRPTLVQQPFQSPPAQQPPPMPDVKQDNGQSRFTCIMCNQNFEQSNQLNEHMSQCPMAPGASQQGAPQADPSTGQFVGDPQVAVAAGTEDNITPGFPTEFPQESPATTSAASWSFQPPDGSPSGVNVSASSSFFSQQQSPPSTFGSPGQSPRAGGSGSSRVPKRLISGKYGILCKRSIMIAILQTAGPISTHKAVNTTWKFLKSMTLQQFVAAAEELENLNLGRFVKINNPTGRASKVFIKKVPEEAQSWLEAIPDLCDPDLYAKRFHRPSPKSISWHVRSNVVAHGLVANKLFM